MRGTCVYVGLATALTIVLGGELRADAPESSGRAFWSVPTVMSIPEPDALATSRSWPEAGAFTGLSNLSSGQLSRTQPVFWIARDATRLVVGWRMPKLDDRPLAKQVTGHDGPLWNDDSVEVFLDPGHTHSGYFQLMANANGVQTDARGRDLSWDGKWEVRTAETEGAWAGLALIPFATLEAASPEEGVIWAANFGVDRSPEQRPMGGWEQEEANLTWSRLGSGSTFHEPVSFGHLVFHAGDRVQVTTLGAPWRRSLQVLGTSTASTSVDLRSAAGEDTWNASGPATEGALGLQAPELSPGDYVLRVTATDQGRPLAFLPAQFRAVSALDGRIETLALAQVVTAQARVEVAEPPAASRIRAELVDPAGKTVREGELDLVNGVSGEPIRWAYGGLPAGDYHLVMEDPARPELRSDILWSLPERPAWLGSTAGKFGDDRVLRPWTPLRVRGRKPLRIKCWGREYTFADGGLFAGVEALGEPLLAGPMAFSATMRGRDVPLRAEPVQVTKTAAGAVEFSAAQTGRGLDIACQGRMEFDGFVRLRLQVSGRPDSPPLDALTFSIPLRAEVARLMHYFPKPSVWVKVDPEQLNARAVPTEGWTSPFRYHVWIGDEEKGLQWLCETDESWRPADPEKAIELVPEDGRMTLRLNLIGRPTELEQPREYVFAFQASPVKPTPPDYRHWHYSQVASYGLEKAPYSGPGVDRSVTYPATGNLRPEHGTLEITLTPKFDSTAPGELNRTLFSLYWPADTRAEPERGMWFYWNQDDRGMRVVYRERSRERCVCGSRFAWKPGETHTVAFTWGEEAGIFVDREKVGGLPEISIFEDPVDLSDAVLKLGGTDSDFVVQQVRVSDVVRPAEELGTGGESLAADDHTLLLDRFGSVSGDGDERRSRPVRIADGGIGRVTAGALQAQEGLDLARPPMRGTYLDYFRDLGPKFLGYHESWSDWQGFPRTSHTEDLRSLIAGCHEKGLRLILYHSWQLSDTAPEYGPFLRECEVVHPERFIYTREPKQKDYPVCARSAWGDFLADGMQTLFRNFGPDGIYSDGLSYPVECNNPLHGCGYVGEDGRRHPTFSLFAVRDAMKRFRFILEEQGRDTLFVCHTSGAITLPTLAFADAYLDGEHLCGLPRPLRVPLDAFRAEFMGHNFGLPAYFLVYDWLGGMTTPEGLALSLLHDAELPWSYEAMAPVWRAWNEFGADEAEFQGYWDNGEWLASAPEGVRVSAYLKPDGERLLVAVNTTETPVEGTLRLREPIATARNVLEDRPVSVAEGAVGLRFLPWQLNLIWVKPAGA